MGNEKSRIVKQDSPFYFTLYHYTKIFFLCQYFERLQAFFGNRSLSAAQVKTELRKAQSRLFLKNVEEMLQTRFLPNEAKKLCFLAFIYNLDLI